jgi:hypothetical protein
MAFLHTFHQGRAEAAGINQSHVVILPKKVDVTTADGFHPVRLQNCASQNGGQDPL